MKSRLENLSVQEIIRMRDSNFLKPNWEYQRGAVWKESQMRLLIDSVFRGYQIPLIFLHEDQITVRTSPKTVVNTFYHVIDGQQRINAFAGFYYGLISTDKGKKPFKPLFDPGKPGDEKHFPSSFRDRKVEWAGCTYKDLSSELQQQFLETEVPVVYIECEEDEARDLFIRLQGGRALSPQEVRDAHPGDFCKHVLEIGGKHEADIRGHRFFEEYTKNGPAARQLVAQLLMLFLIQREGGRGDFSTIKSSVLDEYYVENLTMTGRDRDIKRFKQILDKLVSLLGDQPVMQAHSIIHLVLFAGMLMDEYAPNWEDEFMLAYDKLSAKLAEAKRYKSDYPEDASQDIKDMWQYHQKTKSSSDTAETIRDRHEIYAKLMLGYMGDSLKPLDPKRAYTHEERVFIFYRDGKKCHFCGGTVEWDDAEIHHVIEHRKGGQTTLDNGALVHKQCHPRGRPSKQ